MSKQLIVLLGKVVIQHDETESFEYYVLPAGEKIYNLLSYETCENSDTIKVNVIDEISIINMNKNLFTVVGKIPGKIYLNLKPEVTPVIARRRCFAQFILPQLKETLKMMEKIRYNRESG